MVNLQSAQSLVTDEADDRFPTSDIRAVIDAVEDAYAVRAQNLKVFKGEFDRNIRFDDPHLGTWLIKVSTDDVGLSSIYWQESLLNAARAEERIPFQTPHLLTSTDGRTHIKVCSSHGKYIARVVSWIEGQLMSEGISFGRDFLQSIGEASAYLTRAFTNVPAPSGVAEHAWLIHRGPDVIEEGLAILGDDHRVSTVREIARSFKESVLPRLHELPWTVVHHDLHDANIIVNDLATSVIGVIDFNDAAHAPRISDLAIAGAYAMLRQVEPEPSFRSVVDGYRSVIEPTPEELELVGEMALMRLCMNWAQWQSRAMKLKDNEYALTRSKFTWPLIEHLAEVGPPRIRA